MSKQICGSHGIFRSVTETSSKGRYLTDVAFQKKGAHLKETQKGLDFVQFGRHTHMPGIRIDERPIEEDPRSLKLTTDFQGEPNGLRRRVEQTIMQDGHTRLEEVRTDSSTTSTYLTIDVDLDGGVQVRERDAMSPEWPGHNYRGSVAEDGQGILLQGRGRGRELGFLLAPSHYRTGE